MAQDILIIGANGGIGLELAKQLTARGDQVLVTCRRKTAELAATGINALENIDITTNSGLEALVHGIEGKKFDAVILVAGLLEGNRLGELDVDSIRRQFEINALAPLRIADLLRHQIPKGGKLVILSSRMGSIDDNDSGGSYGYRMSKAAVNAAGKSLSIDLAAQGIAVGILHPGWVRTAMTGNSGNINADECASQLIERLDELNLNNAGRFVHAEGHVLPW